MNEDDIFSYSVLFSFLTLEEKILRTESDNLDDDVEDCSICLEQLNRKVVTSCNHEFHAKCILQWNTEHDQCPLCRNKLDFIYK